MGWLVLDDTGLEGDTLAERRVELLSRGVKLYPLNEQVNYLRQLYKYKSGNNFIDSKGRTFSYKKTSGLNKVEARKIKRHCEVNGFDVFIVEGIKIPFMVDYVMQDRGIDYASIMHTQHGPFLYDLVKGHHETYRRKI
jgi:hypothetical protein